MFHVPTGGEGTSSRPEFLLSGQKGTRETKRPRKNDEYGKKREKGGGDDRGKKRERGRHTYTYPTELLERWRL